MALNINIVDVWSFNMREELDSIIQFVKEYPIIAFDTEFPGTVGTAVGAFLNMAELGYNNVAVNVNATRLIQLGMVLFNENGEVAGGGTVWQFNFEFSLEDSAYLPASIKVLCDSGINLDKHKLYGINQSFFGILLRESGLLSNNFIRWISFHGTFDLCYFVNLINTCLPNQMDDFLYLRKFLFPVCVDVKVLMGMKFVRKLGLKGGLQEVADKLCVTRLGPQHQSGSDALLTGRIFFKIIEALFKGDLKSFWIQYDYARSIRDNDGVDDEFLAHLF